MFADILALIARLGDARVCMTIAWRQMRRTLREGTSCERTPFGRQRQLQSPIAFRKVIYRCPTRSETRSWTGNRRDSSGCRVREVTVQILGELTRLPGPSSKYHHMLPLPWFHRAALSLSHGTSGVYVAYLKPSPQRSVGDIIVSVIDPRRLHRIRRISLLVDDRPGIVSEAAQLIADHEKWNIALSETVTIDSGGKHYLDLYIEPDKFILENEDDDLAKSLNDDLRSLFSRAGTADIAGVSFVGPRDSPILLEKLDPDWESIQFL
jgi:hypothetical protein